MTSLLLCPMLTSSLGWIGALAPLAGKMRDDLVGIHVGTGAGPGLKDIHGKLLIVLALGHLQRRRLDGPAP